MRDQGTRAIGFFFLSVLVFGIAACSSSKGAETRARDEYPVIIGASMPAGVKSLEAFRQLKMGDMVLTAIPETKADALAVAEYCRKNNIYLCFSELLYRGSFDLCWAYRKRIPRQEFFSRAEMEEIIAAAGPYYFGRYVIGEIGCVVYAPEKFTFPNWKEGTDYKAKRDADMAASRK